MPLHEDTIDIETIGVAGVDCFKTQLSPMQYLAFFRTVDFELIIINKKTPC